MLFARFVQLKPASVTQLELPGAVATQASGNRERAAIDQIMVAPPVKAAPFRDITRGMFSHPDLDFTLSRVFSEIMRGRGLAVLRGMSAVSVLGAD